MVVMKIKRVYLINGKPTTRKTGLPIGYLNERGIITPYQSIEVDNQTTTFMHVDEAFADKIDKKIREQARKKLIKNTEIN
jgi:hypothetical protein